MTSDALLCVRTTFTQVFRLFTSWHIPGTNFSPALWFFGILTFIFAIKWIRGLAGASTNISFKGKDK